MFGYLNRFLSRSKKPCKELSNREKDFRRLENPSRLSDSNKLGNRKDFPNKWIRFRDSETLFGFRLRYYRKLFKGFWRLGNHFFYSKTFQRVFENELEAFLVDFPGEENFLVLAGCRSELALSRPIPFRRRAYTVPLWLQFYRPIPSQDGTEFVPSPAELCFVRFPSDLTRSEVRSWMILGSDCLSRARTTWWLSVRIMSKHHF
jgi:hypothetical protein